MGFGREGNARGARGGTICLLVCLFFFTCPFNPAISLTLKSNSIAHFSVTVGNKAGVDLVLIQPFLLYYANHVVMLTRIF